MSVGIPAITVTLNGESHELPTGATLPDLLKTLEIDPDQARGVAVAVNDEVVRRARWSEVVLNEGDAIEVITAVQGG